MKILLSVLLLLSLAHTVIKASANNYSEPGFSAMQRDVIVHLMDWRYTDIAFECEQYLSPMGYAAVQISPPQEHILITDTNQVTVNVWTARYQPVSYELKSASGTIDELQNMIDRCNNVGIRIFAEIVVNHMANLVNSNNGYGGSSYDGISQAYPGVPYNSTHFHTNTYSLTSNLIKQCPTSSGNIEDFNNLYHIRNCKYRLNNDLDQSNPYVQSKVANLMNELIEMGVGGFYVGDATLIWPDDLRAIYSKLNNLNTKYFNANTRPFIYNGIIDSDFNVVSTSEYTSANVGRVTEIKYLIIMTDTFQGRNTFAAIASKFFTGMLNTDEAIVQLSGPITNMMDDFEINSTVLNTKEYELASATMLAIPYGIKVVTSTYKTNDKTNGPPSDIHGNILPVTYYKDGRCGNDWICEHRWPSISHMVKFSVTSAGHPITGLVINSAGNQMSFTRGDVAFFAVSKDPNLTMMGNFYTTLPPGRYCDVTTGSKVWTYCTGRVVTVDISGYVNVTLAGGQDNMLAIHLGSMIEAFKVKSTISSSTVTSTTPSTTTTANSIKNADQAFANFIQTTQPTTTTQPTSTSTQPTTTTTQPTTTTTQPTSTTLTTTSSPTSTISPTVSTNIKPTIIFVYRPTAMGEVLFLHGGIISSPNCTSSCDVPITHKYYAYNDTSSYVQWSINDSFLNWNGAEPLQGTFRSLQAKGTPLIWTTNDRSSSAYVPWNEYGDHYWMAYLLMDCSFTDNGWFNVYASYSNINSANYATNEYTDNGVITQQPSCSSSVPNTPNQFKDYHTGMCGMRNVFQYGNGYCAISDFAPM